MVDWFWSVVGALDSGEWSALATMLTFVVALVAVIFALVQLRDAREVRRESSAPYVIARFEHGEATRKMIDFVIENIGQTPAFDVKVTIEPPMERTQPIEGYAFMDAKPIASGIKMLAPGQTVKMFFDAHPDRYHAKAPHDFTVTVNGKDSRRRELPTAVFEIDSAWTENSVNTEVHNLHWIGDRVKGMEKAMDSIADTLSAAFRHERRYADPALTLRAPGTEEPEMEPTPAPTGVPARKPATRRASAVKRTNDGE